MSNGHAYSLTMFLHVLVKANSDEILLSVQEGRPVSPVIKLVQSSTSQINGMGLNSGLLIEFILCSTQLIRKATELHVWEKILCHACMENQISNSHYIYIYIKQIFILKNCMHVMYNIIISMQIRLKYNLLRKFIKIKQYKLII